MASENYFVFNLRQNGMNSQMAMNIANTSSTGIAQANPITPIHAFNPNINGISKPPLRTMDKITGCTFLPAAWKIVIIIKVKDTHGQVKQMILKNSRP